MILRSMIAALALALLPATAAHADAPDFLRAAHQINLAEISAGRIAWSKTTDASVKRLSAALMRDHIHLDADLYLLARELRVALPHEPTVEQQSLAKAYREAEGETFDEFFISSQLAGHRAALEMVDREIAEGGHAGVKALAEKARAVVAEHHRMFREAAVAEGLVGYLEGGGRH